MMNRIHTIRLLAIAMMLLISLQSCEMPATDNTKPTIALGRERSETSPQPNVDTPVVALIHRVDVPLDVSLEASWAEVDERSVPVLMHGMWMVNGLRVGILHADHAKAFADALPAITGESRGKLFSSFYPTAIRSTPRLIDPVMIDLTVPPRSPSMYKAQDGRLQLLTRIGRVDNGQAFLELIPHLYKPRPDLIPRSPLEKQLDGEVFKTLSVMLPVDPDTAIVVGLYRLWPEPEVTAAEDTNIAESKQADTGDEQDTTLPAEETKPDENPSQPSTPNDQPVSSPPIPDTLGKSLMTGMRAGQPMQILILISVIEDEVPKQTDKNKQQ